MHWICVLKSSCDEIVVISSMGNKVILNFNSNEFKGTEIRCTRILIALLSQFPMKSLFDYKWRWHRFGLRFFSNELSPMKRCQFNLNETNWLCAFELISISFCVVLQRKQLYFAHRSCARPFLLLFIFVFFFFSTNSSQFLISSKFIGIVKWCRQLFHIFLFFSVQFISFLFLSSSFMKRGYSLFENINLRDTLKMNGARKMNIAFMGTFGDDENQRKMKSLRPHEGKIKQFRLTIRHCIRLLPLKLRKIKTKPFLLGKCK